MTRTQYYTATSIDGFIADPDNSLEWLFALRQSEAGQQEYPEFIKDVGALAMGSTTYQWIRDHEDLTNEPQKWPYEQPTWVFTSRELPAVAGADIRFVSGDVAPVHGQMVEAADGKNVWIVGGGELVGQFADAGLLDDIILGVGSVFLGAGAPLLPRRITSPRLRLVDVTPDGPDFVTLRYELDRVAET
jgi:dihydrofolate reductase